LGFGCVDLFEEVSVPVEEGAVDAGFAPASQHPPSSPYEVRLPY
jgi:hypothetical protein